jgi:Glu-tRNA(Gln) amidotransferase subunit E-like FAD-binding protein
MGVFFKNFSLIFFQDVDLEICIFAGLVGLFMGEVMKSTRGKADPSLANKMIIQELEKHK